MENRTYPGPVSNTVRSIFQTPVALVAYIMDAVNRILITIS